MADTYAALQGEIADWLKRSNLTANIPSFIRMFEDQVNYGFDDGGTLRTRDMDAIATLTATGGVYTLPADYLEYRTLVDGASGLPLEYVTTDWAADEFPAGAGGPGSYFSLVGNALKVYPANATTVTLEYVSAVPNLSASTASNWLLAKSPGLYLYGSLVHAAAYIRNMEMVAFFKSTTLGLREGLAASDRRSRFARVGTRVKGPTP